MPKVQIDPAEAVKALETAENECWSIKCESYATGGDDYDVGWEVISHWQAEPHERVEGRGSTPLAAILDAMNRGERTRAEEIDRHCRDVFEENVKYGGMP